MLFFFQIPAPPPYVVLAVPPPDALLHVDDVPLVVPADLLDVDVLQRVPVGVRVIDVQLHVFQRDPLLNLRVHVPHLPGDLLDADVPLWRARREAVVAGVVGVVLRDANLFPVAEPSKK